MSSSAVPVNSNPPPTTAGGGEQQRSSSGAGVKDTNTRKDEGAADVNSKSNANNTAAAPADGQAPAAPPASYFPSQEVAIGTLVRSFIVDGVFRDHFPLLSPSSTALPSDKNDGNAAAANPSPAPNAEGGGGTAASPPPSVVLNEDGSTSHPPTSDALLASKEDQLATQAIARDLLQSLRQPADVPLYTRCSAYPNVKRRLLCHPDISPEEIRSSVPHQYLALFAVDVPAISLTAFAIRLVQRMHCGIDAFIWAIGLMFRVSGKIPVCSRSVHRMLLAATVISAKCRNDIYYSMSFYAGVGGVARGDLRAMEVAMLTALDFTAYLTPRTYVDLLYSMRQHCAQLTHTYKKAWASEAWAAFIVSVPLAHQAAFDPQAVLGPPPTPPHLRRENITVPARTKPFKAKDGTLIPADQVLGAGLNNNNNNTSSSNKGTTAAAANTNGNVAQRISSNGDATSAAADGSATKKPKTGSSPTVTATTAGATSSDHSTVNINTSNSNNSATAAAAAALAAASRDGRVPQGPAGSAFFATGAHQQQHVAAGTNNNGGVATKKGTYAYFAATGDDGSTAGASTDEEGNSSGGGGVKVYTTTGAAAASNHSSNCAAHPAAAAINSVVHNVDSNNAAIVTNMNQAKMMGGAPAVNNSNAIPHQNLQNQHQNHPNRQVQLQPFTGGSRQQNINNNAAAASSQQQQQQQQQQQHGGSVTSPFSPHDDVRSLHSSVQSFSGLAGTMSNSDASQNMRLVGVGPVVRTIHPNNGSNAIGMAQQQAMLNAANGGAYGAAVPSSSANNNGNMMGFFPPSGAPNGVGFGGNPHAAAAPHPSAFFAPTANNLAAMMQQHQQGGEADAAITAVNNHASNQRQRYVPSENTSMNSFSDFSGSGSGHGASGPVAPRPMMMANYPPPSANGSNSSAGIVPAGMVPNAIVSNNNMAAMPHQLQQQQIANASAYNAYAQQQQQQAMLAMQQQQQHAAFSNGAGPNMISPPPFGPNSGGIAPNGAVVGDQQQFALQQQQLQQQQQQLAFNQHGHQHPSFAAGGGRR